MKTEDRNAREGLDYAVEFAALGYAYPHEVVGNREFLRRARFAADVDSREPARGSRMTSRYWCGPEESSWTLARQAACAALEAVPGLRDEIDAVLVTSSTTMPVLHPPEAERPGHADLATLVVRDVLGRPCLGLDLKACYCTGFLRALQVADSLLGNANYRAVLVVSTEQGSRLATAETNRSSFTSIVGDAAGAVVLRRRPRGEQAGILDYNGTTDASRLDLIGVGADGMSMVMRGAAAAEAVAEVLVARARELLDRNKLSASDIDWLLPIQGHPAVIDSLATELGLPSDRIPWTGGVTGFSGSASIPSVLAQLVQKGQVTRGQLILSVAAGAGLNSAGALYRY
jgi:3-oxoacyl-[acyl-carrier-protein] synthase-3